MGVVPSPATKSSKKVLHHRRPATWPDPPWHEYLTTAEVRKLVARCAMRKLRIFACFPEYDKDDLIQIGFKAVLEGWHGFNPRKGAASTFVYTLAWRRIRDEYRGRERKAKTEGKAATVDADGQNVELPPEIEEPDDTHEPEPVELLYLHDGETLPDWLHRVYIACKVAYKAAEADRAVKRGRKWFSPAQSATAAFLMMREKLTIRSARDLFKTRPDLCRALRLRHPPSYFWWAVSRKFLSRKFRNFSAMQERYVKGLDEAEVDGV